MGADAVTAWLAQYKPRYLDPAAWDAVRGFVCESVMLTVPDSIAVATRVTRVLTKLAVWCRAEGIPLDREQVLDPAVVERFIAVSETHSRSRATDRWQLRKIGPLLTAEAPWEPRPATVARRSIVPPYSAIEMQQLRADAERQAGQFGRQAARAFLVLGAGAGLDGRWVAKVTPEDVTTKDGVVLIAVREPHARIVPVLAQYADDVANMAASCTTGALIGVSSTSRSRVAVITARLTVAQGHPLFSPARFRSTWLTTHIDIRTRLPELLQAAGLKGLAHLSDLLAHLEGFDEGTAHRMLRGFS